MKGRVWDQALLADIRQELPTGTTFTVAIRARDTLRLRVRSRTVPLAGANIPTALTAKQEERVFGLVVIAGPLPDGLTPNTSTLWLGASDLEVSAAGDVLHGAPLGPGAEREFEDIVDLADVFIMSATAADVARILFLERLP